ncbi:uncharacterized protein LOC126475342 isoform X3 [Schistocerca serialis cubense]|uniref:uncharacterized protein LOC126475342 isoform X2 n=1 Tax=Schistocerca serialis cubense TaxID=2023355 RepID=UPI00214F3B12|nr:uncharacterized protein LOC126475342 isoform X2 [Schistocerca serialis cubense]XP_049959107.1 uncharacterized protein LOC126475342 isoform X3 [Schistocerca serialis cubense]
MNKLEFNKRRGYNVKSKYHENTDVVRMNKLEFNKRFWDTMSKSDTVNKNSVQAQVVSESAEVEGIAEFLSWAEKDTGVNNKSDTPQIESILGGLFDKKGDAEVFNGAKGPIAEIQIHRGETEDGVVVEEEEEVIEGHLNNDPKSSDVIDESVEEEIKVFVELKSGDVVKVSDVTNMGNNEVNLSEMQTRECVSEDKLLPIGNYETLIYENGNNNNNNKENIKGWNVNVCFQEKGEKFLEVLWNNYGNCINKDAFWKELAKVSATLYPTWWTRIRSGFHKKWGENSSLLSGNTVLRGTEKNKGLCLNVNALQTERDVSKCRKETLDLGTKEIENDLLFENTEIDKDVELGCPYVKVNIYIGPFEIKESPHPNAYRLIFPRSRRLFGLRNITELKPYKHD